MLGASFPLPSLTSLGRTTSCAAAFTASINTAMHDDLHAQAAIPLQQLRVAVTGQQHQLKEQQAGNPDRGGPAQELQHHFTRPSARTRKEGMRLKTASARRAE